MGWTRERAKVAALKRHHPDADHTDAERDLKAARAEDYIRRTVDSFPPLTDAQRARLASLLTPPASDGGHAA